MHRRIFLAALLSSLAPLAHADPVAVGASLTLDEAIGEGLRQSPQIQRSRAAVEEARWRRFEALGSGFLPKVSIAGQRYLTTQYTVTNIAFGAGDPIPFAGFYPNTTLALDVSIPIFNGLANVRGLQGAGLLTEASEHELSRAEFQLRKDIQLAFFQALAAAQLDDVAEENVRTLEDHLRQINLKRRNGAATRYDELRVEVQLNEARADAIDAKDNVMLTRKKLTQLLGATNDERPLAGSLPAPDAERVKDLQLAEVPTERDDIQALGMRAEAADRFRSAQAAWLVPQIALGGQYLVYEQQSVAGGVVSNTGNYQNAYNVGVQLRWNLFDGGVALARSRQAVYQATQAEKAAEASRLSVPYDFEYWKRRYVSNTDHFRSKSFDITRSLESVRLAKAEERAGTRTSTETLDAELDLFRARAGAVSAQVNAAEAQIHLELALGRSL